MHRSHLCSLCKIWKHLCLSFFNDLRVPKAQRYVSCGLNQMFTDFRVPQVVPAPNDSNDDGGGGGDEPTTTMPHSHQQANTHRDQTYRSVAPLTLIRLVLGRVVEMFRLRSLRRTSMMEQLLS